jgi:hypothetical protein
MVLAFLGQVSGTNEFQCIMRIMYGSCVEQGLALYFHHHPCLLPSVFPYLTAWTT